MKLRVVAKEEMDFGRLVSILRSRLLGLRLAGEVAKKCKAGGFELEGDEDLLDLGVELERIGCKVDLR